MKRQAAIAAAALGFALLVGLGLWQLDRRAWKHDLMQAAETGLAAPPEALRTAPAASERWRRVTASGRWGTDAPVRIAPRTLDGKVGGDYAAPFVLADGSAVVVLIGWAPDGAAAPALPDGAAEVAGALVPAPEPNLFTPDNRPPDQWLWLEPAAVAAAAGLSLARTSPLVLRLEASPPGLTPRPARPTFADNHLQYAFTWFGLAAALLAVGFVRLRQRD